MIDGMGQKLWESIFESIIAVAEGELDRNVFSVTLTDKSGREKRVEIRIQSEGLPDDAELEQVSEMTINPDAIN